MSMTGGVGREAWETIRCECLCYALVFTLYCLVTKKWERKWGCLGRVRLTPGDVLSVKVNKESRHTFLEDDNVSQKWANN